MARKSRPGSGEPPAPDPDAAGRGPEAGRPSFLDEFGAFTDLSKLSALQLCDLIAQSYPAGTPQRRDLSLLRMRIEELESTNDQAREAIEALDAAVAKLTSPANRLGTLLELPREAHALVAVSGSEYLCAIDPRLGSPLLIGTRVLLNEAYVLIGDLGFDESGPIVRIQEILSDGRLRVGQETLGQNLVVRRSSGLTKEKLKPGLDVRLDGQSRVGLEVIPKPDSKSYLLERVPELPWERIGGQAEAVRAVRDAVEMPLLHAELFRTFQHTPPKGILLHGPPGCGKTLLGKAVAYNLTRQLREQTGQERVECFIHVKGPEILNMWVGESERQVRELFAQARERSRDGFLPFIFIDEAESVLGTRRSTRHHSILSTLVPMFCAEMDGIESLHEMVIILASNRADLIDPAILRPGRIDRKIKVARPDRDGAREIYRIYLNESLPYAPELVAESGGDVGAAIQRLTEAAIERQFARSDENRFLEVWLRSGRRETLYRGDLASGAIIESIVKRAKELAIKRAIGGAVAVGLSEQDLITALEQEYRDNDIFPPTDITEDWLKLIDRDPENVVKVAPIRPRTLRAGGVI